MRCREYQGSNGQVGQVAVLVLVLLPPDSLPLAIMGNMQLPSLCPSQAAFYN